MTAVRHPHPTVTRDLCRCRYHPTRLGWRRDASECTRRARDADTTGRRVSHALEGAR